MSRKELMKMPNINFYNKMLICFSSVFGSLHSQPDAFCSRGVKGRGCFKAYKAAARIDSSHSSRAGASADVCHHLPRCV